MIPSGKKGASTSLKSICDLSPERTVFGPESGRFEETVLTMENMNVTMAIILMETDTETGVQMPS